MEMASYALQELVRKLPGNSLALEAHGVLVAFKLNARLVNLERWSVLLQKLKDALTVLLAITAPLELLTSCLILALKELTVPKVNLWLHALRILVTTLCTVDPRLTAKDVDLVCHVVLPLKTLEYHALKTPGVEPVSLVTVLKELMEV